ncbi:unnamed protein product [Candidula unifasciata]|uniref:Hamartin n=1 Tax=Candidula unifasciata TaxID=100452 RepID=A0A8S3ZJ49_9EUPU|nr:unnamed protein product [Candidula unifasciata]
MAAGGGNVRLAENIFQLLESSDTAQDIRQAILDNLSSTKESWLIHFLVDYYFQTQSTNIMEILADLQELHAKALMDKLQDGVKMPVTRLPALQLVLYLVYKELPWCHKLVGMPLFTSILKCLETEIDVPILMTGLMTIVILLPSVPVSIGPHLQRIFDIFRRLAVFCVKKPANTPEVFILHLQVALYSLFQRLYGMYPCSFIAFMSKFCSNKENILTYEEVMMPMLERVRLHPKLITGQNEIETSASRWKNQETHDIIVNCSKLSLDLIEGSWEDSRCPVFHTIQSVDKYRLLNLEFPYGGKTKVSSDTQATNKMVDDAASINSLFVPSLDASALGESPSVLIGLSTPPLSQRTTPAASFLDQGSNSGLLFDSEATPRQHTPSQTDEGERTPLSRSSSRGTFHKSLETKRSSLIESKTIIPVPQTTPVTPGSHNLISPSPYSPMGMMESSPLRSKSSAFVAPTLLWSPAARSLQFERSLEEEDGETIEVSETLPAPSPGVVQSCFHCFIVVIQREMDGSVTVRPSEGTVLGSQSLAAAVVPVESLPGIIGDMNTPDTEKLDQEVEAINESVDHFHENPSPSSSVSTLASQTDVTVESVRQFMKKVNRIRFNSLTSNSSSDFDAVSVTQGPQSQLVGRPRSCPPLKRHKLPGHTVPENSLTPRMKSKQQTFARERLSSGRGLGRQISMVDTKVVSDYQQGEDSSDDIASYSTGSSKDTPLKSKPQMKDSQDVDPRADLIPPLPCAISQVFQFIFAPSKLAVCSSCYQQVVLTSDKPAALDTAVTTTFRDNEVSLFSVMSPPELLDRHLRLGSDLHAKELTQIPLTSKESTNWTHFGGVPPADEVNILRGQILLIQNQLLYERHKRSNHAKRNRRLLRRITHVTMLEEQQKTLAEQMNLQEKEIQQLKVSVKLLQEDNRMLRQGQESDEYQKLVQFRTSLKENKDLKAASVVLKNLLLQQKEEHDRQQKRLDSVLHKNLESEKELEICRERLALTDKLSQRVFQLQKELLLTQEFRQKCQEQLQQNLVTPRHKMEESLLINSLKAEIADFTRSNKKKSNMLEAYQTRVVELEEQLRLKENAIAELKRNFEDAKHRHDDQVKAVEERCQSMVHIAQQLEAKVMELTCKLDQTAHRNMVDAMKAIGASCGGVGSATSGSTASVGITDNSEPLELTEVESSFAKASFDINRPKSANVTDNDSAAVLVSEKPKNITKHSSFEVKGQVDLVTKLPAEVTVVVAGDEVSVVGSTFRDNSPEALHPDQVLTESAQDLVDIDLPSDSGAASRTSYRVDSDASMKSVSGHSLATGDSGCWPKD